VVGGRHETRRAAAIAGEDEEGKEVVEEEGAADGLVGVAWKTGIRITQKQNPNTDMR